MRLLRLASAVLVATTIGATSASAQTVTTEVDTTVGTSTERASVAAVQVRLFGPIKADWRIYLEGSWAATSQPYSDAFSAAFPYDKRLRPIETYAEKTFHPGTKLFGIRLGQYRTPFGISGRSDHGYSGFVRPPLIRNDYNWALSNNFLEAGVDVLAGKPSLFVETSLGVPNDQGSLPRRRGLDAVVRAQAYVHSLVLGASYITAKPNEPGDLIEGRLKFGGVDARWMHNGVQVRGEWIAGVPFAGATTTGGYLDAIVHRLGMGPVTAVARIERLDYAVGPDLFLMRREVIGARVRVIRAIGVQINLVRQNWNLANGRRLALDAGLTYTLRR